MARLTIFESEYWCVSFRKDSRHSGHLIVATKCESSLFSEMPEAASMELGMMLSDVESLLIKYYSPFRVVAAKMGFSVGHGLHFHIIPVSMALLAEIASHKNYTSEPDGNDVLLYVSREYCERDLSPVELEWQVAQVENLRKTYAQYGRGCG